jgi:hypothetical protein
MFGTQHQRNAVRSSIGLVACLIASAIVESQSLAQDVAPVAESQAAPDSQPPAFANNDRFHIITVKAKISDRFEIYDPHSVEQLQAIRDMGFRQVILDWPYLHREATQLGLDVVIANWWTIDTEVSEIEKRMEFVREIDPERFAAISMMDEPERNSPDTPFSYYQALYGDLKKAMQQDYPNVPLEMSHWGPLASWSNAEYEKFIPLYQSTDLIRIMPYPDLREGPLSEVYYQMLRSRHVMKLAGREIPQLVILQTWELPENPKLPTIGELRVMAYQAILTGAETVSFFSYEPEAWSKTPGFIDGFRDLMSELTTWTRRYKGQIAETSMSPDGVLQSTIAASDHQHVTIRINTNRIQTGAMPGLAIWTYCD